MKMYHKKYNLENVNIGEKLKLLRDRRGLTNEEMCELLDEGKSNLMKMYRRLDCSFIKLLSICNSLDVDFKYFIDNQTYEQIETPKEETTIVEEKAAVYVTKAETLTIEMLNNQVLQMSKEIELLRKIIELHEKNK
jgi:transcriptional regulator with XRE-family HTH domain